MTLLVARSIRVIERTATSAGDMPRTACSGIAACRTAPAAARGIVLVGESGTKEAVKRLTDTNSSR